MQVLAERIGLHAQPDQVVGEKHVEGLSGS
jgi:hypothetical protein